MANDLLAVLSVLQFVFGLYDFIIIDNKTYPSYISQGWFTYTRQQLQVMNAQLWIEDQWFYPFNVLMTPQ